MPLARPVGSREITWSGVKSCAAKAMKGYDAAIHFVLGDFSVIATRSCAPPNRDGWRGDVARASMVRLLTRCSLRLRPRVAGGGDAQVQIRKVIHARAHAHARVHAHAHAPM